MGNVAAFAGVVGLIIVVPGPDMALVLRNGLAHGRRAALQTSLGISVGLVVWALAAAIGVAAILHASALVFTAFKLAGAAYLIWLGARAVVDAWRGRADTPAQAPSRRHDTSAFRQGLLSNLLNPKIALVFTTLIPQFVEPGHTAVGQTLVLAVVFICMGLAWLTSYALLVARLGIVLKRPLVRRAIDAVTGTVLAALGVRLALERP